MTPPIRHGFTAMELLLVTGLTIVICGVVLPVMWSIDRASHHTLCGNSQRQLILAMLVYGQDHAKAWPVFTADHEGFQVTSASPVRDPVATAIASCELLAQSFGDKLTPRSFACPSNPMVRPDSMQTAGWGFGGSRPLSRWAADGGKLFGYAYDWSVPVLATGDRVVTADRNAHEGDVIAAFADGHIDGLRATTAGVSNHAAGDDDIRSDRGDGPMDVPGGGSTTRSFVR